MKDLKITTKPEKCFFFQINQITCAWWRSKDWFRKRLVANEHVLLMPTADIMSVSDEVPVIEENLRRNVLFDDTLNNSQNVIDLNFTRIL